MKQNKNNYSKFIFLWMGELISSIGSGLTSFGLGVYIFQKTGSAGNMALITLFAFLPTILFSLPAGVLADRYDRRALMMIGDGFSALGILFILLNLVKGEVSLIEICFGVFISSIFSSLLEPSYKATVSDLLTKNEYSKACGMISLAGSARYLISPILAGILLSFCNITILLLIDVLTFFPTVIAAALVRKDIEKKPTKSEDSFMASLKEGWKAIRGNRGIFILVLIASSITFFMGSFQILAEPLILDFTDSKTLGIGETICASGMLLSSLFLGIKEIKRDYVKVLCLSLFLSGITMVGFGIWENVILICTFGFLFFSTLPFANNSLDYLIRTNIFDSAQGRAWGVIGFLSQIGYVIAYLTAGTLADVFSKSFHITIGRSSGLVILIGGILLLLTALILYPIRSIRALEDLK